jgi:hypothetical protein
MRKSILYGGGVLIAAICTLRIAPVRLLRFSLDPGAVQPRMFVLLNPLRDRSPERIADGFLRQLAMGRTQSLVRFYGANRELMLEEEVRYPPVSWRLSNREDHGQSVLLTYLVARGGGYKGEEEAIFEFVRSGEWKLLSYNAIYDRRTRRPVR